MTISLPPVLAPSPLLYPTQHWSLTLRPPPPNVHTPRSSPPQCPHPQVLPPPNVHTPRSSPPPQCPHPQVLPPPQCPHPQICDPHQSLYAALEWSLPHPALSIIYLFWQSDKRLFFFLHYSHLHSFVLFNWFALYLPCALCHFTLSISFYCLFFIVSTMSSLYICIVCMYIWLNCIYLYLNVYCQCLMLTVCTKGLRVTQFQFSVCMYCTCGRIDNKARLDLTWPLE